MSAYELLKFLHIVAVIAWLGGGIALLAMQSRLEAAGDRQGLMSLGSQMEGMGKFYFSPAAAVALVTGVSMVLITEAMSFEEPWIFMGFAGMAVSIALGVGALTPAGRRLLDESRKPQPDPGAMASLLSRIRAMSLANIAILLIVVWAMVAKPGA